MIVLVVNFQQIRKYLLHLLSLPVLLQVTKSSLPSLLPILETSPFGTCIEKLSDRSYVVKTNSDNQVLRRNREFLKPAEQPAATPQRQTVVVPESLHQMSESPMQNPLSREDLLNKYHEVFSGLGHTGDAKIVVDKNVTPVQHSPRRVPVALQKDVKKKILELEEQGIIKKAVEPSEWISSIVIVAKPQKIRICLDPKDLNRTVQRPKLQMPTLEELLPELSKARIFSSFDAKDGFYQVSLDDESSKLTAFWTHLGRYRYLRMPFGITLAPEVFESKIQECLTDLLGLKVIRDDILVLGCGDTDFEALVNHDQNVIRLLERAKQVNLKLNNNKVKLREAEVKFMGHVISKDGSKPDPEKVSAIKNMPKPRSKPEVLTLLGFVNYLSKFLPKLSDVSAPLRELTTGQSKFTGAKQHNEAFATIQ